LGVGSGGFGLQAASEANACAFSAQKRISSKADNLYMRDGDYIQGIENEPLAVLGA
jgi:hypothetical protein